MGLSGLDGGAVVVDSRACAETMMTWELVARLESEQAPGRQPATWRGEVGQAECRAHVGHICARRTQEWSVVRALEGSLCQYELPAVGRCICEPLLWKVRSLRCKAPTLSGSEGVIEPRVLSAKMIMKAASSVSTTAVKHRQNMGKQWETCSTAHHGIDNMRPHF